MQTKTVVLTSVALIAAAALGTQKDKIVSSAKNLMHVTSRDHIGARIVTVDVAKLLNAQRMLAAGLLSGKDADITTIQAVGQNLGAVIEQVAGAGTLVLVKQAVVVPAGTPDITDTVMQKLGLPTDAPTLDTGSYLEPTGDTMLMATKAPKQNRDNSKREVSDFIERNRGAGDKKTSDALP